MCACMCTHVKARGQFVGVNSHSTIQVLESKLRLSGLVANILAPEPSRQLFFQHEEMLIFVQGLLCNYWDEYRISAPESHDSLYYIFNLRMLKHPCMPGVKPTW